MKKVLISLSIAILGGCSSAGPFITNISSDGRGGLNIEKCSLQYNLWKKAISNQDCRAQSLQLTFNRPQISVSNKAESINKEEEIRKLQQQNIDYNEYQRRYNEIMNK